MRQRHKRVSELQEKRSDSPALWVFVVAAAVAVLGGWTIFKFESQLAAAGSWPVYAAIAVLYIPVQILAEGAVGIFWEDNRWFSKVIAVGAIVAFYMFWFRLR